MSLLYSVSMKLTCISLRPYIIFLGWKSTWGHFRQQGLSAVPATISSSFFFYLLLSSIRQHFNISETLCSIILILVHNNKSANAHFWHDQFGVKGHVGVTGVKSQFSPICYFFFRLNSMTMGLMYIHQLDTLYKSYGSINSPGVIWGHRGQKVIFHQKCYFSFRLHGMVMRLMHIHQLDTIYKSYGSRNSPGVIWGHGGQKVIFIKNAITRPCYIAWP